VYRREARQPNAIWQADEERLNARSGPSVTCSCCHLAGYSSPGSPPEKAVLTLPELDSRLRTYLVETYNQLAHSQTGVAPEARWEADGFLPRLGGAAFAPRDERDVGAVWCPTSIAVLLNVRTRGPEADCSTPRRSGRAGGHQLQFNAQTTLLELAVRQTIGGPVFLEATTHDASPSRFTITRRRRPTQTP
jgi:hypothetical protein